MNNLDELESKLVALVRELQRDRDVAEADAERLAERLALHKMYPKPCELWDDGDAAALAAHEARRKLDEHRERMEDERKTPGQMRDEARRCTCPPPPDRRVSVTCPVHFLEHKPRDEGKR